MNGRTRLPLLLLLPNAGGYKHCVIGGQENCGNNLAAASVPTFKLLFEIVNPRQSAVVNQS
jgi:hypothetical protein